MQKSSPGDFEIDRKFAEGPYAVVVSSHRAADQGTYALKLFGYKQGFPKDDWILREAEYLKSLRGLRGAVQLAAVFNDTKDGILPDTAKTHLMRYPVIVMERLTGGSLESLLEQKTARGESLTEGQAALIFRNLIVALHEVHVRANLIHCNLKTLNVYFSPLNDSFPTKLVDFGFSVALYHRDEHYGYDSLTGGRVMTEFTPDYLAPETLEEYDLSGGTVFSRKTGQLCIL